MTSVPDSAGPPSCEGETAAPEAQCSRVTVILSCCDQAPFLESAVRSVMRQSLADFEAVILEGALPDQAGRLVRALIADDSRFRILRQGAEGLVAARNAVIAQARTSFIAPLDADDVWHPDYLALLVAALEQRRAAPFALSHCFRLDASNRASALGQVPASAGHDLRSLVRMPPLRTGSAAVFRSAPLKAAGGYDESLRARGRPGAEDWKLVLTLAQDGNPVVVPRRLVGDRSSARHRSGSERDAMRRSGLQVLKDVALAAPTLPKRLLRDGRTLLLASLLPQEVAAGRWSRAALMAWQAFAENPVFFLRAAMRRGHAGTPRPLAGLDFGGALPFLWLDAVRREAREDAAPTPWAAAWLPNDGVTHLDRSALDSFGARPEADGLFVFWQQEVPVAQATFRRGSWRTVLGGTPPPPLALGALQPASLVICTRDRPDALRRCLASLAQQTHRPREVIVVDNASLTDETRQVALEAEVTYVREDRPGLDIARNSGAAAASCPIIAYTDDDVVLHPDWLARLVAAFDAESVLAVTGLVLPAELASPAQWHFEMHWGFGRGLERVDFGPAFLERHRRRGAPVWEIGAGASMAFRRTVFERVGWFDERLDVGAAGCSGDSEFWHRILAQGGTCRYEPSAVAFHYHRREWEGLRRQLRAYMSGHGAALLVQHERSGDRGSLRRLLLTLPAYYLMRLLRFDQERDRFLKEESLGLLAGAVFYARAARSGRRNGRCRADEAEGARPDRG